MEKPYSHQPAFDAFPEQRNFLLDQACRTNRPDPRATVTTTLGALREMSKMDPRWVALPPMLTEFILDNGLQHDDTRVVIAPGQVWIEGTR